ncbi:hypothetical protein CC2G_002960 [Coprinopsis cinerea AmutBmut pab1-1]|nr:hypothetical protein CC2G_002960 [Coprinopsis cinerea AmutBmut pab1-1]
MPGDVVKTLDKVIDNFVYAKGGAQKMNAVGIELLRALPDQGGLQLLDLQVRNEAVELMKLKAYVTEGAKRPTWAKLADEAIRRSVTNEFKRVDERYLISPFTQRWRVNLNSPNLPSNLRRMIRTADKYNVQYLPIRVTTAHQRESPFWYHLSPAPGLRATYNDKWGRCHQSTHFIQTVGQMLDHADKNRHVDHTNRWNCDCFHCWNDRNEGCENPIQCRRNADKKLDTLQKEWDPRVYIPLQSPSPANPDACRASAWTGDEREQHETGGPSENIRALVQWKKDERKSLTPYEAHPISTTRWERQEVSVYTDGSCSANGTASARAGSGIWYGPEDNRNRALRLPDKLASNNAGELAAILAAIQDNQSAKNLHVISDSKYAIDAITKHIGRWADEGFTRVKNKPIVHALFGELVTASSAITLEKVKGHSGDAGNDGADRLAATGADIETRPTRTS